MPDSNPRSTFVRIGMGAVATFFLVAALIAYDWWSAVPESFEPSYIGGHSCIECHQGQHKLWTGSHHDLAMDEATDATVLGDFNDATLEHFGITSKMFRRDGRFFVNTEGPNGKLADFEISYVFGVEPLQQYMVEFDRTAGMPDNEIARLQVLRVSWNTEKQEWFYLSPPDVDEKLAPDDPLHWTRSAQNWNHMCASCHSTNLHKNFDPETRTYHTTFSDIDVNCEACHGPGSLHVELANANSLFWDRNLGYGLRKVKGEKNSVEVQACAPCHSRRRTICPDHNLKTSYYDNFMNELFRPETYHADGQIKDEVYVFGSFIQSKMYHKDIKCSDCHDPHTTRLKHDGNAVCTSCHQHPAAKYDHSGHHHHQPGSPGASCVACHMPESPFMEIDLRADHSLRVPRPDLSVSTNTPNACTGCHLDKDNVDAAHRDDLQHYADWLAVRDSSDQVDAELRRADQWCADAFQKWYAGKTLPPNYGDAFAAAWKNETDIATEALKDILDSRANPAIVRASALLQLAETNYRDALQLSAGLVSDRDPQVRATSLGILEFGEDQIGRANLLRTVEPLLRDPTQSVRIEAARILASVERTALQQSSLIHFDAAIEAYRRGLIADSDQAAAHMSLGILEERFAQAERSQQRLQKAISHYRDAIRVQPDVTGPRSNLAGILEQLGQQDEVAKLRAEELKLLERDAAIAPDVAMVQYRYGLSLYLNKRMDEAAEVIAKACDLAPDSVEYRYMLTGLLQNLNRFDEAIERTDELIKLQPTNSQFQQLRAQLLQQKSSGNR
ncbi:MAG: tetratricopeptide repeat protein [Planctomycetales bacterium]|nr:tetratricopeptide repeat protein [Planctomycetales bacterium]